MTDFHHAKSLLSQSQTAIQYGHMLDFGAKMIKFLKGMLLCAAVVILTVVVLNYVFLFYIPIFTEISTVVILLSSGHVCSRLMSKYK